MKRLIATPMYFGMYFILHLIPFVLLVFILTELLHLNIPELLGEWRIVVALGLLVWQFLLPGYRANLAGEAYADDNTTFLEAHRISGTLLRAHLSFLPVIGKLFEQKK